MAFKKGHPQFNSGRTHFKKGKHYSIKTEFKKGMKQFIGKDNINWKGNKVGYLGLHKWLRKWKGKSDICEQCGKSGLSGKKIHLANLDHKYRRILDDYIYMCVSCHQIYDFKMGFRKKIYK